MRILIDTRETKPLKFRHEYVDGVDRVTLPTGDYSCEFKDGHRPPIVFERKSLGDLYSTLSNGYERFKKEIIRAHDGGINLIIIVETSLTKVFGGYEYSRRDPESLVRQIFTLQVKHGIPTVFCSSRSEMSKYMVQMFGACGREHIRKKK